MAQTSFEQRLFRLHKQHKLFSLGVSYRVNSDGLIVRVPRRRILPRLPVMPLLILLAFLFASKVLLFTVLEREAYEARRAIFLNGSMVERGVAWLLQPEPVTEGIAFVVHGLARAG